LRRLILLVFSSAFMGFSIYLLRPAFVTWLDGPFLYQALGVLILIAGGAVAYFGTALVTGAIDRALITKLLRR